MSEYDFDEQLEDGQKGENELDRYYSQWFYISTVSMNEQRMGIDRIYTHKENGHKFSVEYKSDKRASFSGNAFVETMSVDTENKLGWAFTSLAQVLFYYLPLDKKNYLMNMQALKNKVMDWKSSYSIKRIKNDGYYTEGVPVPLTEFSKYCKAIHEIKREDDDNGI